MNVLNYAVNLKHRALEVYLAGCYCRCAGRHSTEPWNFSRGLQYAATMRLVGEYIKSTVPPKFLKNIWILGAEPLDHPPEDVKSLIDYLTFCLPEALIWIFTSNTPSADLFAELRKWGVDYVKYGPYDESLDPIHLPEFDLTLASSNQKIVCLARKKPYQQS